MTPNPPTPPDQSFELDLLKTEYFFLQTTIEDYNKQIWVIKALGITGTGAAIALTLQKGQPLIALIGCAIPVFFWVLESQWKHYQRGFYPRVAEIEQLLTAHGLRGPAIFGRWQTAVSRSQWPTPRQGYIRDGLLNRSVFVSYGLEIGFLIALFFILKQIPITP